MSFISRKSQNQRRLYYCKPRWFLEFNRI